MYQCGVWVVWGMNMGIESRWNQSEKLKKERERVNQRITTRYDDDMMMIGIMYENMNNTAPFSRCRRRRSFFYRWQTLKQPINLMILRVDMRVVVSLKCPTSPHHHHHRRAPSDDRILCAIRWMETSTVLKWIFLPNISLKLAFPPSCRLPLQLCVVVSFGFFYYWKSTFCCLIILIDSAWLVQFNRCCGRCREWKYFPAFYKRTCTREW